MKRYRVLLLALVLSLLVHLGALLSGHLPAPVSLPEPVKLQPLSVKMQAMSLAPEADTAPAAPPAAGMVAARPARAPAPRHHHRRARVVHHADAASAPVAETAPPSQDVASAAETNPVPSAESAPTPPVTPPTGDHTEPRTPPPAAPDEGSDLEAKGLGKVRRFPDNSRVDYQIYYGSLMAGHGDISWQRNGSSYTLEARLTPIIGPTLRYQSRGSVGKQGLSPLTYQAWRGDSERESAHFDWSANTLAYGDNGDKQAELTPGTQDILSLGYQLALTGGNQLPPQQRITTGKKVYDYPLAPGGETRYPPEHGALRVVVFRAKNGDEVTEFWLAPDFANLPVRILRVDKDKTLDQRARRIDINGKTVWSLSEKP